MIDKKVWTISGWVIALAALSIGTLFSQEKAAQPQEVVEVSVQKLNMRTGNGTNYRVIKTLTKGTQLIVVNDKKGWLEVRLPADTKCWITKQYVEATNMEKTLGVIKVGRINVRSRPGTGENVIGHITEGQAVTIKSAKGNWYQIAPTENMTGWVNKKYTRYWGNSERLDEVKNKAIQDEANNKSLTAVFNQAEKLYEEEMTKSPLKQDYKEILLLYKEVINNASDDELLEKSRERVNQLEPKQQMLNEYVVVINKAKTDKQIIEQRYKDKIAALLERTASPEPYDGRGWVEPEGKYIGRPAAYKLTMGGKTLFFLKSSSALINLDDYYGQYIGVKGKKVANKSGVAATIIIEKIDLLTERD